MTISPDITSIENYNGKINIPIQISDKFRLKAKGRNSRD